MMNRVWGLYGDFGANPNLGADASIQFQNAVNTIITSGGGSLFIDGQFDIIGSWQSGYNSLITFPVINEGNPQVPFDIIGYTNVISSGLSISKHLPGKSLLKVSRNDGIGIASLISGLPGIRNNIHFSAKKFSIELPSNSTITGLNLACQQDVDLDILVYCGQFEDFGYVVQPTHTLQYGVILPQVNNDCFSNIKIRCWGCYTAVKLGELFRGDVQAVVCQQALEVPYAIHPNYINFLESLECPITLNCTGNGNRYLAICQADLERSASPYSAWQYPIVDVNDPSNLLYGEICYNSVTAFSGADDKFYRNGGSNFSVRRLGKGVVSPPPIDINQSVLTTQIPTITANDGQPYELGMRFSSSTVGIIKSIKFWKSANENLVVHTGRIWNVSGQLLISVDFDNETSSGWQKQDLISPLVIQANTEYIVSVNVKDYFADTQHGFDNVVTNGNLKSSLGNNGVFGSPGSFPTNSYANSNYFRDVIFVAN